jgi:hypothetical protein
MKKKVVLQTCLVRDTVILETVELDSLPVAQRYRFGCSVGGRQATFGTMLTKACSVDLSSLGPDYVFATIEGVGAVILAQVIYDGISLLLCIQHKGDHWEQVGLPSYFGYSLSERLNCYLHVGSADVPLDFLSEEEVAAFAIGELRPADIFGYLDYYNRKNAGS